MKRIVSTISIIFCIVLLSENKSACQEIDSLPRNWQEFKDNFEYGGSLYSVGYDFWMESFPKSDLSVEEKINRLLDITTLSKTVYRKKINVVDSVLWLQTVTISYLLSHLHIFLKALNERTYEENLNFWIFVFSSDNGQPQVQVETINSIIETDHNDYFRNVENPKEETYKYFDLCHRAYKMVYPK